MNITQLAGNTICNAACGEYKGNGLTAACGYWGDQIGYFLSTPPARATVPVGSYGPLGSRPRALIILILHNFMGIGWTPRLSLRRGGWSRSCNNAWRGPDQLAASVPITSRLFGAVRGELK